MKFTRTLHIAAPRIKVWGLLADTERLNREIGLPPVDYEFIPRPAGGSETIGIMRIGRAYVRYREMPFDWVRPDFYGVRRLFTSGPLAEFRSCITLRDRDEDTEVLCEAHLIPRSPLWNPLVSAFGHKSVVDFTTAAARFEAFLNGRTQTAYPRHSVQAPVVRDRFERGLARLIQSDSDPTLARRLADYVAESPPEDVTTIRPFVLADAWGAERMAVLRTCLLAARERESLLELRWRLLCPSCRGAGPQNTWQRLADVKATSHCPSCNIRFDADFDSSVEVCFAVSPAVRPVREAIYCIGGPALSPHVAMQAALEPGEARTLTLRLPVGRYAVICRQAEESLSLHAVLPSPHSRAGMPLEAISIAVDQAYGKVTLRADKQHITEAGTWTLANNTTEPAVVRLESPDIGVPVATAAVVSSLQTFRDQFSSEVLSPGTEIAVRHICILFTDLKGSTAMYRERGDASSYRIVRDHFDAIRNIVSRHDGAVVKTIGDAIMASFTDPAHGLAAALDIQKEARGWLEPLIVKLGLHSGPAIAVNANDIQDFFGQTVNLASRLQSESLGNDIVVAAELAEDARVSELLESNACRLESFMHEVRGFTAPVAMLRITLPTVVS